MSNVKYSWRNTAIPPPLLVLLTWWMLSYCGSLERLWCIELSEHQVSEIYITLNSNLSVINRLKRLSKFFCTLLIFRFSIEKLLLPKWFKFREDSSGVKHCESLIFHLDLDCHYSVFFQNRRFWKRQIRNLPS